jgi:hypothetical protein
VTRARERYIERRRARLGTFLADTLGALDPTDTLAWKAAVGRVRGLGWRRIENTMIAEYLFGRGGAKAMGAADGVILDEMLASQRRYWNGFMSELSREPMSMARITQRANLYTSASRGFFERGRGVAWRIDLPAYPGDGSTACRSNCTCTWDIRERKDHIEAIWRLGAGENCDDCQRNAVEYAPLRFDRPRAEMEETE